MKKLVFAFVALAAMSFASCGNTQNGEAADTNKVDTPAVEVAPVDTPTVATEEATAETPAEAPAEAPAETPAE